MSANLPTPTLPLSQPHGLMQRAGAHQVNTKGHGVQHAQAPVCCTHNCQQGTTCPVRTAYAELRMPNWPPTLAMTLQDPMRAAVIHARAAQLAAQQRQAAARASRRLHNPPADPTPANQLGLVSWWRGLRLGARQPSADGTPVIDHKRAAAGDRDD